MHHQIKLLLGTLHGLTLKLLGNDESPQHHLSATTLVQSALAGEDHEYRQVSRDGSTSEEA